MRCQEDYFYIFRGYCIWKRTGVSFERGNPNKSYQFLWCSKDYDILIVQTTIRRYCYNANFAVFCKHFFLKNAD